MLFADIFSADSTHPNTYADNRPHVQGIHWKWATQITHWHNFRKKLSKIVFCFALWNNPDSSGMMPRKCLHLLCSCLLVCSVRVFSCLKWCALSKKYGKWWIVAGYVVHGADISCRRSCCCCYSPSQVTLGNGLCGSGCPDAPACRAPFAVAPLMVRWSAAAADRRWCGAA